MAPKDKKRPVESSSDDDSSEEEVVKKPVAKKPTPAKKAPAKKVASSSDDDSSEDEKPAPKKAAPAKKKAAPAKKAESSSDDDSSEDEKPAPKKAAPAKKAESSSDDDSSEDEKPAPKKAAPAKKKAAESSDDDSSEDEAPAKKPAAKKAKKAESSSDEDSDDEMKVVDNKAKAGASGKMKIQGAGGANPTGATKVFIGNLSWSCDDDQTKEFFKDCGEVQDIHWLTDKETGKFLGRGFVEFGDADAATAAVALADTDFLGRPIKVDFATPRPDKGGKGASGKGGSKGGKGKAPRPQSEMPEGCTTVFVGNLSYSIDDDGMHAFFKDCGEIAAIRWLTDKESGEFKGCGFVEFSSTEAVKAAGKKNGQDLLGRPARIDFSAPRAPKW